MTFLVAVGALQFVYCVIVGNYVRSPSPTAAGGKCREGGKGKGTQRASSMLMSELPAFQCLFVRLQRYGRPVRAHGEPAHPDEPGE